MVNCQRRTELAIANLISNKRELTIGSCFSVHYRVRENAGSLEGMEEA